MELHDGPLQSLAISLMALDRARARTERGEPDLAKQEITFARDVLGEITTDMRGVLANLSAEMLAEQGLAMALRHHAESVSEGSDMQVTVENSVQERLPVETEVLLYRLVQEAVANARKHSEAKQIEISITKETYEEITGLHLAIKDNGIGFDLDEGLKRQKEGSGLGLRSMRQRIVSAGGDMKITSVPGSGTTLEFWCPI
jgi:signal transduction histidine kinase